MSKQILKGSTVTCGEHALPMQVLELNGTTATCGWESPTGKISKTYDISELTLVEDEVTAPAPGLIGKVSDEKIQEWKTKFNGKVYGLEVDGHIAYFSNPNRQQMNASMSRASMESPLDMYEQLARLTFLGGSAEVLKDDDMFYGITQQLKAKMDGKKATMVNL